MYWLFSFVDKTLQEITSTFHFSLRSSRHLRCPDSPFARPIWYPDGEGRGGNYVERVDWKSRLCSELWRRCSAKSLKVSYFHNFEFFYISCNFLNHYQPSDIKSDLTNFEVAYLKKGLFVCPQPVESIVVCTSWNKLLYNPQRVGVISKFLW